MDSVWQRYFGKNSKERQERQNLQIQEEERKMKKQQMKYRPTGNNKNHLGLSWDTFVSQAKRSGKIITGSGRYLARKFQESLSLEKCLTGKLCARASLNK